MPRSSIALPGALALSALVVALAPACSSGESAPPRPDVVLILLDTTRADNLGPFGGEEAARTPFLDRLAEESLVFENAWTGSTWTGPSSATVFTGLVPPRHGLVQNLWAQVGTGLDEERDLMENLADIELIAMPEGLPTIPEHLHGAGYQTVGVATNPNLCEDFGFTRGFDSFTQKLSTDSDEAVDLLIEHARDLDPERPRFLFLHLNDPHVPYKQRAPWCPHEGLEGCSNLCRYRSEISFLDGQLARMFRELEIGPDALVVLVNDHGEEFHDHGEIGHRYSVHAELARAALMVHAPGVEPRRTKLPAHHVDILPTILERLDLRPPAARDGLALIPALDQEAAADRPLLTHRIGGKQGRVLWGLTWQGWRLFEETPDGVVELYDVRVDPGETRDLSAEEPERLAAMRAKMAELRAGLEPLPAARVHVDMTDQLTEELIKLGYAGDQH